MVLDTNGKTLTTPTANNQTSFTCGICVDGGSLELIGNGTVKNQFGLDLTVDSTADEQIKLCSGKQTITIESVCLLCRGEYSLSVSLENRGTTPITYYDYIENAAQFKVICRDEYFGVFHNKSTFIISDGDIIE